MLKSAWQPRERALLRVMRERGRGSGLPISDDACRSILGGSSRSLVALPGLTLPRLAHRQHPHADSRGQPAPCSDNLDEVRRHSVGFHVGAWLDPRFSPVKPGSYESCPSSTRRIYTYDLLPQFSWHRPILTTKHVHAMIETQLRVIDKMTDTLRAAHD